MDNRKFNGAKPGGNKGAGRKPKSEEIELIEKLKPLEEIAFKALELGVKKGSFDFIKLFMEYRFGKAKQSHDLNSNDRIIRVIVPDEYNV